MGRITITTDDYYGIGLRYIFSSNKAKTDFLLESMPAFYSNTVENIRSKGDYQYADTTQKLIQYIGVQQKKKGVKTKAGIAEDPIVLKTNEDNRQRCQYCIKVKKWKGIGHTEEEC